MSSLVRIEQARTLTADATELLEEYYEAADVVQRDPWRELASGIEDGLSRLWLAYQGEALAGCVMLKLEGQGPGTGLCKRLYVRPACRRSGIAEALMEALEGFACQAGLGWIYLDTNEAMHSAIALYCRRGYTACERFNDNPRANLFFRKKLGSG